MLTAPDKDKMIVSYAVDINEKRNYFIEYSKTKGDFNPHSMQYAYAEAHDAVRHHLLYGMHVLYIHAGQSYKKVFMKTYADERSRMQKGEMGKDTHVMFGNGWMVLK